MNFQKKSNHLYNGIDNSTEVNEENIKTPKKIGGVLYLIIFGLIIAIYSYPRTIYDNIKTINSIGLENITEYYDAFFSFYIIFETSIFLILSIMVIMLFTNIFEHKKFTIILLKIYFISTVIISIIKFIVLNSYGFNPDNSVYPIVFTGLLYTVYVFLSKRVKETFIK